MATTRGRPKSSVKGLLPSSTTMSTPPGADGPEIVGDDVEDLLAAANDDRHEVWLWRRGGVQWDFLAPKTPVQLRELGIRANVQLLYGGGTFKARLRERGGKWGVSRQFSIEGAAKTPPLEPTTAATVTAAPATPVAGQLPEWAKTLIMPVLAAVGTAFAARVLAPAAPAIDPAIFELLKRAGGGDGLDAIELQRLVLDAERRGEERGRELGELSEIADRPRGGGGESSGVLGAIDRAAPLINRMLDAATGEGARRRRRNEVRAVPSPSSETVSPSPAPTVPDIVPPWLRPFIGYKDALINVADRGKSAEQYADIIIDAIEDDESLLTAIVEANKAGRLLSDLTAAMPEIVGNPAREKFAAELITAIQEGLGDITEDDAPPADAPSTEATGD